VLIIGETKTKRLMYEGEHLDAGSLLAWGFLDRVCPGADLEKETLAFAAKLAAQPREVIAVYQEIFRALRDGDAAKARELRAQAKARTTR
jgi:enoyl-CoA hydratase/carnithine racemase